MNEFEGDAERALRGVVEEGMRPVEMGEGERGARKRYVWLCFPPFHRLPFSVTCMRCY